MLRFNLASLFIHLILLAGCAQDPTSYVINSDVDRFWQAYDQIILTEDTTLQLDILKRTFIDPGTPGLKAIMEKKRYTPEEYIHAINNYASFWESVRANTYRSEEFASDINNEVAKLKKLYPELKPAYIYFTVGVLRTGGTAHDGHVLIGSEAALVDSSIVSEDIRPDWLRDGRRKYFDSNPIDDVVLLNLHEYVHTQQSDFGYDLLSQSLYEGVAEYVSVLSHGGHSASPAIPFGQANAEEVKKRFEAEMFSPNWNDWLYNNDSNDFEIRDLGYYVGYAICEQYHLKSHDKKTAIKTLIELDYQDRDVVEALVGESGYFEPSIRQLRSAYESSIPKVLGLQPFSNGLEDVDHRVTEITVEFSEPMSDRFRNQRIGPLGIDYLLPVTDIKWAKDMMSITYTVELEPGKRYQLQLDHQFRSHDGPAMNAYLIDFTTKKIPHKKVTQLK